MASPVLVKVDSSASPCFNGSCCRQIAYPFDNRQRAILKLGTKACGCNGLSYTLPFMQVHCPLKLFRSSLSIPIGIGVSILKYTTVSAILVPKVANFLIYEKGKLYEIIEDKGVKIVIDPKALMHVYGTKIEFVDDNLSICMKIEAQEAVEELTTQRADKHVLMYMYFLRPLNYREAIGHGYQMSTRNFMAFGMLYQRFQICKLSVLVDRSVGELSIVYGPLELMFHRRLLYDDGKGVAEALNETVCVGKFYITIDPLGEGAKWCRSYGQEMYSPRLLAFTELDGNTTSNFQVSKFLGMDSTCSLPENVVLLTLQELDDGKVLLRLANLYEVIKDDRDCVKRETSQNLCIRDYI
ncbi:hypothetical protein R6Q59_032896 [Mikania micrantha]